MLVKKLCFYDNMKNMNKSWWEVNSIYQIYPKSFRDTNGDGIGDLRGIIEKLPYLKGEPDSLGVDAIWLSPIFMSPQLDNGYDVKDYYSVDPLFGGMAMLDELILRAHQRDMKVMLDFVPNHSSIHHQWFKEASSSRDNPKRDYYVWRDAKPDGSEPTNWLSMSGGKAWTWHEPTQQYYLHSFLSDMPDLNWDNPVLREEMLNVLRFWFRRGIDGFRVDAIWPLSKTFEDNPMNPDWFGGFDNYGSYVHKNSKGGPNLTKYLRLMSDVAAEFDNRFLVYEFYPDDRFGSRLDQYANIQNVYPGKSSVFFFEGFQSDWNAGSYQYNFDYFGRWNKQLPVAVLGNHDQTRIVSKFGPQKAKALAVMQLTLPGVPGIYYGEELGMSNVDIKPEDRVDRFSGGAGLDARDDYRTPMQWDDSELAGFSDQKSWLPIGENKTWINVETERKQADSFWSLYQKLLKLRSDSDAIRYGEYFNWRDFDGKVMTFGRKNNDQEYYVLVNFEEYFIDIELPQEAEAIISSNTLERYQTNNKKFSLGPLEAVVFKKL